MGQPHLPPEILSKILQYLADQDKLPFSTRLVSKTFKALATPLCYHTFTADAARHLIVIDGDRPNDISRRVSIFQENFKSNVSAYWSELRPAVEMGRQVMMHTQVLDVRFFWPAPHFYETLFLHSNIKTLGIATLPRSKRTRELLLSTRSLPSGPSAELIGLSLNWARMEGLFWLSSLPLKTLEIFEWFGDVSNEYGPGEYLGKFLCEYPEMDDLNLKACRSRHDLRPQLSFSESLYIKGSQFPAFKRLTLRDYDWLQPIGFATTCWDWSRLISLSLVRVAVISFLRSVGPENLNSLKAFSTDGHGAHSLETRRELEKLLIRLFETVKSFHSLHVPILHAEDMLFSMAKHSNSLNTLSLFSLKQSDLDVSIPPVILDIYKLAAWFKNIYELHIDLCLDWYRPTLKEWVAAICRIRNLRRLNINLRSRACYEIPDMHGNRITTNWEPVCRVVEASIGSYSPDHSVRTIEDEYAFLDELQRRKMGARFESITTTSWPRPPVSDPWDIFKSDVARVIEVEEQEDEQEGPRLIIVHSDGEEDESDGYGMDIDDWELTKGREEEEEDEEFNAACIKACLDTTIEACID